MIISSLMRFLPHCDGHSRAVYCATQMIMTVILCCLSQSVWAQIRILQNTTDLHIQFSGIYPPFGPWRAKEDNISKPFSIVSDNEVPVTLTTHIGNGCVGQAKSRWGVCMKNTAAPNEEIYFAIRYTPCGSNRGIYLTARGQTEKSINLSAKQVREKRCERDYGALTFRRYSLYGRNMPLDGLYRTDISITLSET